MKVEGGNEEGGGKITHCSLVIFFCFKLCAINMKNVHQIALSHFLHAQSGAQNPEPCEKNPRNWQSSTTDTLESHRKFTQ